MEIVMLDQKFACKNEIAAVEQVFQQLSQWMEETGQQLVCLDIDGVEVSDGYEQYIVDHLADIQQIVVKVKTVRQLLADSLVLVRDYLERAIPAIDKLVDEFYHDVTPDTWKRFAQLLEGMDFILNRLEAVNQHAEWYFNARQFSLSKDNLSAKITMLQEAMVSQDRVWLSDLLLYEIVPVFKSLMMAINASQNNVQ